MASPSQGDLFRGLRFFTEPSGKLRLEGTVKIASRYTGLSPRSIHRYIEDGEIPARVPGDNRADTGEDSRGRRRGFKKFLNMAYVWRIAYGPEEARKLCEQLGVDGPPDN